LSIALDSNGSRPDEPLQNGDRILATLKRIVAFVNGVTSPPTSMSFRPLLAWMRTRRIRRQPIVLPCSLIIDLSVASDVRPFLIMKQAKGPVKLRQIVQSICIYLH
jgi:hypothetical protein